MAEANCAVCHAIGPAGASPFEGAPEFRAIAAQGDVEDLAEALAEGIGVPHKGKEVMPEFVLEPRQIEDLIAYLNSLKHR
jgi:mono/diheme cytochrome c family protein